MTDPRDSFSETGPRLDDTNGRGALRRIAFLAPEGAEPAWDDVSCGGPSHRLLGWLLAVAHAHLSAERAIDDVTAGHFARALRDPSVSTFAQLLLSLVDARKVRATDVLGLVMPPETPRGRSLTDELRDLLRSARLEAEGRLEPSGDAASRPSSLPLFARFVRENAEGELIVATASSGPLSLSAAARQAGPRSDEPAAFLLRRDGSRLPLDPYVLIDRATGAPSILWDLEDGRLRWLPADGLGSPAPLPAGQAALAEMLLRMGAFTELRDVLRGLSPAERESVPHATLLVAASCHQGALALKQRELEIAVSELEKASRARPDLLVPHLLLAQALMAQKNVDRALDVLKKHAVLFNRSDRLFELMGDAQRQKKDAATALRMYERAATTNPFNTQVERKRDLLREQIRRERDERLAAQQQQAAQPGSPAPAGIRLEDFLVDMTLEAEMGLYHGTVGREAELRQVSEILSCRDKRNVLLVGDPGVGKTALVEDFVLRVVQGRVPKPFRGKKVWLMSVATLLAGAKYRGQFEERVLEVVRLLKSEDALVFVDNIHQLVNSGLTRGGALDASSLLKPYLVRGELQVIGATTHDEFRQGLEKDASLLRCFQVVQIEEPSADEALAMVAHVKRRYEKHHGVALPMSLVRATLPTIDVALRDRALPDKALDVYDRACAVAAMRRSAPSAEQEPPEVQLTRDDVLGVLSEMSRVPVARLGEDARDTLAHLEQRLSRRVVGQSDAVARVARVLRAARMGMDLDARRPRGVFLFVGPSGVGKTELARAMAEQLFGSDDHLIRIDMSEYRERINQSRLIGTAPGYVGYNDQNQLTDEVRKNPHALVLLDEIEKADHDMMHLFLQVFDAGRLTDGKGRTVHFDHATIVMTSNVGTHLFARSAVGFEEGRGKAHVLESDVLREVRRHFAPEFLNRVDEIICFGSLSHDDVRAIARVKADVVRRRLAAQGKTLEILPEALDVIARAGWSPDEGARHLERAIRRLLLEPLAAQALETSWDDVTGLRVGVEGERLVFEPVDLPVPQESVEMTEEAPAEPAEADDEGSAP